MGQLRLRLRLGRQEKLNKSVPMVEWKTQAA